jgi:hypothetical protein
MALCELVGQPSGLVPPSRMREVVQECERVLMTGESLPVPVPVPLVGSAA